MAVRTLALLLFASAACTSSGACATPVIATPLHPDFSAPLGPSDEVARGEAFEASARLAVCDDGGSPYDPTAGLTRITLGLAQNVGEVLEYGSTFEQPFDVVVVEVAVADVGRDRTAGFEGAIPDDLEPGIYFFVLQHDPEIRSAPFRVVAEGRR